MPSLRHTLSALYITRRLRYEYPGSDDALADRARRERRNERPHPPHKLRDRLTCETHGGYPVYTYRPHRIRHDARILYLHGGAYVRDLTPSHWKFVAQLGDRLGTEVVVPQYPLAPESTWRSSRDSLLELLSGDRAERTIVAGDSAGGGLALALAQGAVDRGVRPAGLLLISPWVDLAVDPAFGSVDDDPWLTPDTLRSAGRLWAGDDDIRDPALSPIHGAVQDLPPALIFQGTRDILYPSTAALITALTESGADTDAVIGDGLIHVYPLLPCPEARRAADRIDAFVERILA